MHTRIDLVQAPDSNAAREPFHINNIRYKIQVGHCYWSRINAEQDLNNLHHFTLV